MSKRHIRAIAHHLIGMEAVRCKYCGCQQFVEAKSEEYVNFADDLIPIMDETESEEKK